MAITNAQQFKQLVNPPMDGKRPGYRGPGGYQGGRKDTAPGAAKAGSVERPGGNTNRERGITQQFKGPSGTTGRIDTQDADPRGPDRRAVSQFSQYGKNLMNRNLKSLTPTIKDRIDDALQYYRDYHFDGTERIIKKIEITQSIKDNKQIDLSNESPEIIGVTRFFDIGDAIQSSNLFNIRYQIHLNDLFDFTSTTYLPYVTAMRHVEQLEEIFVGSQPIRFNRHQNLLNVDIEKEDLVVGQFVMLDGYAVVDPDTYTDLWSDWWLRRYATCLIKRQWGENIKKYEGLQLPGGITFNGQKIWEEATEEQRNLEAEVLNSYSLPVMDMEG